ncbi:MAG: recombination regulator RecX [Neisseriaceae bacterium]|nr:recombination regulator RecX [Neisseriaceae bacterium]
MIYSKNDNIPATYEQLYLRAVNYLSRREYSKFELKNKLSKYSDDNELILQVLDELSQKNWQSDERFSESLINSKSSKYGNLRLIETLRQKGVDSETAQKYLLNDDEEIANAKQVLQKKFGTADYPISAQLKQKCYRFLSYRGFSYEIIQKAMRQWVENQED